MSAFGGKADIRVTTAWLPPHDFPTARNPFEEGARKRPNRLRFDCIDQGIDRVQRIVQELQPIALDADEAAALAAPVGSPAILVWRWYYLDNSDLLMIGRSIYPQGRMVFRTELTRSEPQSGE